jgi:hypothetical protein
MKKKNLFTAWKSVRKTWEINPAEQVVTSGKKVSRTKSKNKLKKDLEKEFEFDGFDSQDPSTWGDF